VDPSITVNRSPRQKHPASYPRRESTVVGHHRTAVAECREVLGRVEAERGCRAERTDPTAPVPGTVCLRGVLQYRQPVAVGDGPYIVGVDRFSVEVDRDDRLRARRDGVGDTVRVQW